MLLISWGERTIRKQLCMREIVRMFVSWEYALETQRMRVMDFLEQFQFETTALQETMEEVRQRLLAYEYPTGELVWQETLVKHRNAVELPEEAYHVLVQSKDGFFGTNRMEALRCIRQCTAQMQRCIEEERENYRGKRKVYMPVGMLMGVMLVILLI